MLLCPWDSPGKNTGVGDHVLLQGIVPTEPVSPVSSTLQADPLPTEPPGKPNILYIHAIKYCRDTIRYQGVEANPIFIL